MSSVFYRGDSREPSDIKAHGFDIWPIAKAKVQRHVNIQNYIWERVFSQFDNIVDIQRWAASGQDHCRPTISTCMEESCGGYSGGYIYRIELPKLVRFSILSLGFQMSGKHLHMLQDYRQFNLAKTIAMDLSLPSQEIIFFTKIPSSKITHFKLPGEESFKVMPELEESIPELDKAIPGGDLSSLSTNLTD